MDNYQIMTKDEQFLGWVFELATHNFLVEVIEFSSKPIEFNNCLIAISDCRF